MCNPLVCLAGQAEIWIIGSICQELLAVTHGIVKVIKVLQSSEHQRKVKKWKR
jgi:hypothetical protein